jgi:sigma-B regulation protein RsbU (phosphoserine phosphatase)
VAECAAEGEVSTDEAREAFYAALLDDDPEALYERAPCGYLSATPDGTIIKVNQTFLTWTGYQRAELVGRRTFAELLTAGGRIYHETHYAPMLHMHGTAREIALDILCSDGRRVPALVNSVLERDPDGTPLIVRTAVFEATERREYERELVRARDRAEDAQARATLLARTLQQTLIPSAPPDVPGLDVAAAYRPAGKGDEVGGDFYDVFDTASGAWIVAIGDVCGKGVDAAIVTSMVRTELRAAAVHHNGPSDMLAAVNAALLRSATDRFCTVALIRLDERGGRWTAEMSSAGHPLPVLLDAAATPISVGASPPLGLFEDATFLSVETDLAPGSAIVLYTDGVTEARDLDGFYGEARLLRMLEGTERSAEALVTAVVDDVLALQSGDARDDIAVVAVRPRG